MSEELGQAVEQPANIAPHDALGIAQAMLQQEEGTPPEEEQPKAEAKEEAKPETEAPAEETEQPAEEAQEETPKYKLKVKAEDGSDVEVEEDLEGLKKGYMLERAFRMKTAQIARQKETIEAEQKKAVETARNEYAERLAFAEQVIWKTLAPEIQKIDWNKLAEDNPAEWAKSKQYVESVNAHLAQVQHERRAMADAQQREFLEQTQKRSQEAIETLQTKIPNWGNELYKKILKSGQEYYGFKAEEVGAITDARAIEVLNDARQWREFKAKPIVEKRVPEKPKAVLKPGVSQPKGNPNADVRKQLSARLHKSGDRDDAVALAEMLLQEGDGILRS